MRNEVVAVQKEETCTERRPSLIKTEKPMPCYVESTLAPTAFSYAQKSPPAEKVPILLYTPFRSLCSKCP
ncbi:hypothetical protein T02_2982 [Trichinella nativa]|uniref:Uncharacterized protein n=2 Tax=Trichinella TaxID=6333 RepID=A0A0V1LNW2_9BILA|nr:hypothetical protein T05_851 [Trichinella murrelli]KRX61290.1 hypothetical protein T09_9607 [Trichinella sp. T9]KRZ60850.1 hypothetical protein T02_2982 [Trichinella nativa]